MKPIEKQLVVLNALVAKSLGYTDVKLEPTDLENGDLTPEVTGDLSSILNQVFDIAYFKPYAFTWEDIRRASEDLRIGVDVFAVGEVPKARFTYESPTGARSTIASTVRIPVGVGLDGEVGAVLTHLLKFYLRAASWEWDNAAQISGYNELFDKWFGHDDITY